MEPLVVKNNEVELRKLGEGSICKILFDSVNGAKNFSIGTVIIEPKQRTGEHTRDVEELIFALKGETYVVTENEEYKLEEGDCILIPQGISHYHENKTDKTIEQLYLFAPQGPEKPLRDLEIIK
ncbi:MAG: cupin domain-containing protein [Clostridia bacterium]|nr:cupin domain-containing protein [Clostridia bacterium]